MKVRMVPVAELVPMAAAYNPRRIEDSELEALGRSLEHFGAVQPIVVNRRTGHIVGGHQRVKAAEAEASQAAHGRRRPRRALRKAAEPGPEPDSGEFD